MLSQDVNQYRLSQSTLCTTPRRALEERHLLMLNSLLKPSRSQLKVKNNNVQIIPLELEHHKVDKARLLAKQPQNKPREFNWTIMPPVRSSISKQFGEGEKKLSRGVVYNISIGQPVYAPVGGDIIFAGPMKDFGYVVMIEKNFENSILLAGISYLDIKQGDTVYRGQKIGSMVKGSWVYLEFRNEGNPMDPRQLLVSGYVNEE